MIQALFLQNNYHNTQYTNFCSYTANQTDLLPFYPIHWHEEIEIVKIQSGNCDVCVDGEWFSARQGDIFFLRPFAMHSFCHSGSDVQIQAIVFNLRLLGSQQGDSSLKYFAPLFNEKHSVPCKISNQETWFEQFENCFDKLFGCDPQQDGAELDIKSNLYQVFYLLYSNRMLNAMSNTAEEKRCYTVKRALEFVRSQFHKEITIEKLANHCGYSEFYLMKLFKKFTRLSCVDYANNYRMVVAGQLLAQTDNDVSAIAYQVGFHNISYFNRQFRRLYNTTPKEYRKQFN
ncbi:MAG: helix-turn-helix transcriptional regulator [Clostridia bacterium]|nr:helix-turn-helix transcriptional regulator [Clostridia bacterium]MBQ3066860.1 helix-turn-helix transcriptional regulator [Clostridia bacterium]